MSPEPRRLHPAGAVLETLKAAREALLPIIVLIVVGGAQASTAVLALGGVVVAAVAGYLRWRSTTYRVGEDDTLILRRGVFSPSETAVPVSRVSSVDAEQGPIQRLFGVQEVLVQTAGGGAKPEVVLGAVAAPEVARLREVLGHPERAVADQEEPAARVRLSGGALVAAAVTGPQLGVLLPLVAGLGAVADDLFEESVDGGLVDRLPDTVAGIALLATAVLGALLLISVLGAIVAFSGFTVERDAQRLRIRRGLLQRRAASLPLHRVHAVRVVEGLLRRPFGLATLRVETAGYRNEPVSTRTLFPLVRTARAPALIAELVPALATDLQPLEPPPRRALRRYLLTPIFLAAVAGTVLGLTTGAWWTLVPLVVLAALQGLGRFRAAGWRLAGGRIVVRERLIARHTIVARAERLQEHARSQTPFQRRTGLADLAVAVGSGRRGRLIHLEAATADELFQRLRAASR
ncbi:MAG: PH domain-containing protein [Solirubrobacteraceae bacterium MAG38_C4-C5]|nr:PH domain-containing protein [Candidatus Siliceabacter maunaloa]